LKAASLFFGRVNVRQIIVEAEFWDIRITVSFEVASVFVASLVLAYFLHVSVYFLRYILWDSWNKRIRLVFESFFDVFM